MSEQVTAQDFPEIRWKGHWIWVPEEKIQMGGFLPGMDDSSQKKAESHGLFRKTFTLDSLPARAPARITADSRYLLYVNGQQVYRGPIRSQPKRLHYDLFDLAPHLKQGENVIAVYVKYYGTVKSFWMPAAANATLGKTGVLVFEANLGPSTDAPDGWLVSDASWKAHKSDAWSAEGQLSHNEPIAGGVPVEVLDARKLPPDWQRDGFDDSAWGNAQVVPAVHINGYGHTQPPTDPYGPMYPRPIAKLEGDRLRPSTVTVEQMAGEVDTSSGSPARRVVASVGKPVAATTRVNNLPVSLDVPAGTYTRLLLDMGRIVAGSVQFDVSAPAGTTFDLCYVEDPLTGAMPIMFGPSAGSRYVARGEQDRFQSFDMNGFRYAYLLVHGAAGKVSVNDFAVQEYHYPWQPGAAFECSDAELNRIFAAGIRTVQLNSWDAFMDCPTREQRAWVGDSVVHQMVHLVTNTDWRLAWHYLTLGNSPRPDGILPMSVSGDIEASGGMTIPDWSLHWVHGVYNLYRFTGDREAVLTFMPTVARVLRWYAPYQTRAGVLKDVTEWNLVDWSSLITDDNSAILTALWARGLREFAEIAGWLGENASMAWAEGLYAKAKAGFEIFWDQARGTYVDYVKNGVPQRPLNQIAGAAAIVSGLAPAERWQRIVDTITDPQKVVVSTWMSFGGKPEDAQKRMRNQMMGIYEPDWDVESQIVSAEPFMSYLVHDAVAQAGLADRLPEIYRRWSSFLVNGYDTIGEDWKHGTHVHSWSCTPTKDMVFYTLGVTPAEPGYTKARVAPRLGSLEWARGTVPTPHGLITVSAKRDSLTIDSPVPVTVELPGKPARELPAGKHEGK
jgi:hypothetical protein